MPRVFCAQALDTGAVVALDATASHHLGRVLRLNPGDALVVFDGRGGEYQARVETIIGRAMEVKVGAHQPAGRESPLQLTLAQGICRGARMDYCIQKSVELGVTRIVPLAAKRSVVKLREGRTSKKLAHWRGVARSAAEQSGREILPEVTAPEETNEWLTRPRSQAVLLLLDQDAERSLDELPKAAAATLLVGPESGLTSEEKTQAKQNGCVSVRLGPRVMRSETAGIAALAVIQALWGDLGGS